MEKTTLFVFYNLFMMSIYMGVNVLKPFVLYTLSIVYISIVFFINFNLQDVWETETSSRSEKMALLTWQYLWGIVICHALFAKYKCCTYTYADDDFDLTPFLTPLNKCDNLK